MEWLFCPISVRFKEKTCMEIQKLTREVLMS